VKAVLFHFFVDDRKILNPLILLLGHPSMSLQNIAK